MRYTRLPADFVDRLSDLLCTVRTEQLLLRTRSQDDKLDRIVRLAVSQTGAEVGLLMLLNDDRGDLQIAAAVGEPVAPLVGQHIARTGLAGFAIDEGNPVAIADRPGEPAGGLRDDIDDQTGLHTRSILVVPLIVHDQPCGALELRNARAGETPGSPDSLGFSPDDIALVTELAHLASAAVEEYRGDRLLFGLFASALPRALAADRAGDGDALADELERWLAELRQTPAWRTQLELATSVRALCRFGDDAVRVAQTILDALVAREQRRLVEFSVTE